MGSSAAHALGKAPAHQEDTALCIQSFLEVHLRDLTFYGRSKHRNRNLGRFSRSRDSDPRRS